MSYQSYHIISYHIMPGGLAVLRGVAGHVQGLQGTCGAGFRCSRGGKEGLRSVV